MATYSFLPCNYCGKTDFITKKECNSCKTAYCSPDHYRSDSKNHKKVCEKLTRLWTAKQKEQDEIERDFFRSASLPSDHALVSIRSLDNLRDVVLEVLWKMDYEGFDVTWYSPGPQYSYNVEKTEKVAVYKKKEYVLSNEDMDDNIGKEKTSELPEIIDEKYTVKEIYWMMYGFEKMNNLKGTVASRKAFFKAGVNIDVFWLISLMSKTTTVLCGVAHALFMLISQGRFEFRYNGQKIVNISIGMFKIPRKETAYIPVYRAPKDFEPSRSLFRSDKVQKDLSQADNTVHHTFLFILEDGSKFVMDFLPHIIGNPSYHDKYPYFIGELKDVYERYKYVDSIPLSAYLDDFATAYEKGDDIRSNVSKFLSDSIIKNMTL